MVIEKCESEGSESEISVQVGLKLLFLICYVADNALSSYERFQLILRQSGLSVHAVEVIRSAQLFERHGNERI